MKSRNWHVRCTTTLAMISAIKDLVSASRCRVVFDHFGGAEPSSVRSRPGFPELVESWFWSGNAYVKISARIASPTRPRLYRHRAARQSTVGLAPRMMFQGGASADMSCRCPRARVWCIKGARSRHQQRRDPMAQLKDSARRPALSKGLTWKDYHGPDG